MGDNINNFIPPTGDIHKTIDSLYGKKSHIFIDNNWNKFCEYTSISNSLDISSTQNTFIKKQDKTTQPPPPHVYTTLQCAGIGISLLFAIATAPTWIIASRNAFKNIKLIQRKNRYFS